MVSASDFSFVAPIDALLSTLYADSCLGRRLTVDTFLMEVMVAATRKLTNQLADTVIREANRTRDDRNKKEMGQSTRVSRDWLCCVDGASNVCVYGVSSLTIPVHHG